MLLYYLLEIIPAFIIYSLLYFFSDLILKDYTASHFYFAFLISLLVILLFNSTITKYIHKFIKTPITERFSRKRQILKQLNNQLNITRNYQEVKKILFSAFEILLENLPHSFYIWENNSFFLSHFKNIDSSINLPPNIEAAYFRKLSSDDQVDLNELILPANTAESFKQAGFTHAIPFTGRNQIFALLFTRIRRNIIFREKESRELFKKIQSKAGNVLESTGLFIDLEKKNFEIRKLIEVSQKILASLDIKNILDFILDALNMLISYDAATIFLLDEYNQNLKSTSNRGYDKRILDNLNLKVGQGAVGKVVQTRSIDLINDVSLATNYFKARLATQSQISLPLMFSGSVLGVICVESDKKNFFTQNDVDILKMFASQAALAIYNARQVEIKLAKRAFENELIHAGTVQKGLLVRNLPKLKNLGLTAQNIPSKMVSGDLYDTIKIDECTVGFTIGDVSGKGAPAALLMALILAGFRSQPKTNSTSCDVVNRLNDLLTQSTIEGKYTTFFYGIIRMDINKIIYTNAGHNPPLLFKKNGKIQRLSEGGIVLGFIEDQIYKQQEVEFEEGDVLLGYTDGISEAMNNKEQEFGEENLIKIVTKNMDKNVHEIKDKIIERLSKFSNIKTPGDDITIIVAKHN